VNEIWRPPADFIEHPQCPSNSYNKHWVFRGTSHTVCKLSSHETSVTHTVGVKGMLQYRNFRYGSPNCELEFVGKWLLVFDSSLWK